MKNFNFFFFLWYLFVCFQCDYLLGDKRQQQNIINADNEHGLDPNSRMFQAIMENSFVQRAINNPKIFFGKF